MTRLPAPDSENYDGEYGGPADRLAWLNIGGFDVSVWYPGEIQIGYDGEPFEPITTDQAFDLVAALLAAIQAQATLKEPTK